MEKEINVEKQVQLQSQESHIPTAPQSRGPSLDQSFIKWHAQDAGQKDHENSSHEKRGCQTKPKTTHYFDGLPLNAASPSYDPEGITTPPSITSEAGNLARYLARRDLVSTSLYQFDDRPESYKAWRSSFYNATADIGLTAIEMLDLLIKWLGT